MSDADGTGDSAESSPQRLTTTGPEIGESRAAQQVDPKDQSPARPLALLTTKRLFSAWIVLHVLYLVGGAAAGVVLFASPQENRVLASLAAAASMALAGASAYYLRRIYKAGIQGKLHFLSTDELDTARARVYGTSLYLLLRPLIAALLAIFVAMTVAFTYGGLAPTGTAPTQALVELASVSGFLVGFFSGRSIAQLESTGKITV